LFVITEFWSELVLVLGSLLDFIVVLSYLLHELKSELLSSEQSVNDAEMTDGDQEAIKT